MDRDCLNACAFQNLGGLQCIDGSLIPPQSNLSGHRKRVKLPDDRASNLLQQRTIAKQGRAAVFADHFVNWAAKIEVDEIRFDPFYDGLRGGSHSFRVSAE